MKVTEDKAGGKVVSTPEKDYQITYTKEQPIGDLAELVETMNTKLALAVGCKLTIGENKL